jgi:hypothetical protein
MRLGVFHSIRKPVLVVIAVFMMIVSSLAAGTILDAHHDAWEEHYSPYYGKWDYYAVLYLGGTHLKLVKRGYDPNGLILSIIAELDHRAHESLMKKIPITDGEHSTLSSLKLKALLQISGLKPSRVLLTSLRAAKCGFG